MATTAFTISGRTVAERRLHGGAGGAFSANLYDFGAFTYRALLLLSSSC